MGSLKRPLPTSLRRPEAPEPTRSPESRLADFERGTGPAGSAHLQTSAARAKPTYGSEPAIDPNASRADAAFILWESAAGLALYSCGDV